MLMSQFWARSLRGKHKPCAPAMPNVGKQRPRATDLSWPRHENAQKGRYCHQPRRWQRDEVQLEVMHARIMRVHAELGRVGTWLAHRMGFSKCAKRLSRSSSPLAAEIAISQVSPARMCQPTGCGLLCMSPGNGWQRGSSTPCQKTALGERHTDLHVAGQVLPVGLVDWCIIGQCNKP